MQPIAACSCICSSSIASNLQLTLLACPQEILLSLELLRQHSIPVVRLVQYLGTWIISFPGAYHLGCNNSQSCYLELISH